MEVVFSLAIGLISATWVYFDARKRDWTGDGFANKPWQWAVGVLLIWILAFPFYLLRRRKRPLVA